MANLAKPLLFGILNITDDSFYDGGRYLEPRKAWQRAELLLGQGADVIDIGSASSNPASSPVDSATEISRMEEVVARLLEKGVPVSIDTFNPETQRWAMKKGVDYLNDITGFSDPGLHPELAASNVKLIAMHSLQKSGVADLRDSVPSRVVESVHHFFETRLAELAAAGVDRGRIVLDPGMGFFLGSNPESSVRVVDELPALKRKFGLPLFVSISRKSFIRKVSGTDAENVALPNTVGELAVTICGADFIRTHDPQNFVSAWKVLNAFPRLQSELAAVQSKLSR